MTIANTGEGVYALDDQTVGLTASAANDVACGRISEFLSATAVFVDIERA
jgi:hypothetical protein